MNHSNTNITPNSNMSFMTINSNSSKNKLLSIVKAAKAGGNSQSIQAKLTEQASKLPISSNLLNKIKQKHQTSRPAETARLSHKPLEDIYKPKEAEDALQSGQKGKMFNIALNSAKNVNMFEINNYYQTSRDQTSPKASTSYIQKAGVPALKLDHGDHLVGQQSNLSIVKRLESRVAELGKLRSKGSKDISEAGNQTNSYLQQSLVQPIQSRIKTSRNLALTLNKGL